MKIPLVSQSAWRRLYTLAQEFSALEPWEWMEDVDLFGVQDPRTGEVGYCCVLGAAEEMFGLTIYRGTSGLQVYQQIQSGESSTDFYELMFIQDCLQLEFVDRSELDKEDRSNLKKLGMKFKQELGTPQFRSLIPGYAPWFLNETEVEFFTIYLERAIEFAKHYNSDPSLLDAPDSESILIDVPTQTATGIEWKREWKKPPHNPISQSSADSLQIDELQVKRIEKMNLARQGQWEADFFPAPGIIEDRDRPYFTRCALIGEREGGTILSADAIQPEASAFHALTGGILKAIEQRQSLPSRICVPNKTWHQELQILTQKLGIPVFYRRNLPMISFMKEALRSDMYGDEDLNEEFEDWENGDFDSILN